jgi:hypothetical protein
MELGQSTNIEDQVAGLFATEPLLVPFQRRFSQYKFAVESISLHVEEQSAPEL